MIDHGAIHRLAILCCFEQNVVGLGAIHQALFDEEIGHALVIHSLGKIVRPQRRVRFGKPGEDGLEARRT